jgi:hypothetical protein
MNLRTLDAYSKLESNIQMETVIEKTDNNVNGCRLVFGIKTPIRYTPCTTPINRNNNC